ncbi:MAG: hypothetical protein GX639_08195 [Fibrobacter sp.]|nr:hypothetical protein [Fibrobacter sp.]
MKRYRLIIIPIVMFLFANCSVNNPEITINKEFFLGNWESNTLLERIEFTATNAKWFFKKGSITFDSNSIDQSSHISFDSNYLIRSYSEWELNTQENSIGFLDTFTLSSGKAGWGKTSIKYSVQSENSFYFQGIDSDPILFTRN